MEHCSITSRKVLIFRSEITKSLKIYLLMHIFGYRWLKWRVIGCWQTLPKIMSLEREHESRKQRWRIKVQQVLPDFVPGIID